jgi:hypothetical protein
VIAFDVNSYLYDDDNLHPECFARIRAKQRAGVWGYNVRFMRPVRCADGLEFSMQASSGHYCSPRRDLGPWTEVEIGFPSQRVEEFMEYAEDPSKPTKTVYGWVPAHVVAAVVEAHGGFIPHPPALVQDSSPDKIFN